MKYPDDFNTPAFPAGKFVAVSRLMATVSMVVFIAIIALCSIILWAQRTQDVEPFLVSYTLNGEPWTTISHNAHDTEIPATYVVQESVLNKFIRQWFTISDNADINADVWDANCSRQSPECTGKDVVNTNKCAIYCACGDNVFDSFKNVVLPTYLNLESEYDAIWTVQDVLISPMEPVEKIASNNSGFWKFNVSVQTNMGLLNFVGYARTDRDSEQYKKTMGYYISEFNTYRVN